MDVLILTGLFILNGLFAMSEIAILSARKIRLQQAVDDGVNGARAALDLANEPSHFLSTIQVGITLIGIMSGALGETLEMSPVLPATVLESVKVPAGS
jgi:putative hemolysin